MAKAKTMVCLTITLPDYNSNSADADRIASFNYAKVTQLMAKFEYDGWMSDNMLEFYGEAEKTPFAQLMAMGCEVHAIKACNKFIQSRKKK
jgi:hypothetical protein